MLRFGGYINILIAIAHILCLFWVNTFFELTGVGESMQHYASINKILPYLITIITAIIFFVFGLYGLSAAGKFKKLPLLKLGVYTIGIIYLARGVVGTIINIFFEPESLWYHLLFSVIALFVGVLYFVGGLKKWKSV